MNRPAVPLWAIAFALCLGSCRSLEHKTAIEGRFEMVETDEELYQDAGEPVGGSVALLSMPIQGASHRLGWEIGVGRSEDSFDLALGEYTLQSEDAWVGLRYSFLDGHWRPYVSAGAQFTQHEVTLDFMGVETIRRTDDIGPYVEAGLQLRLSRALHVSLGYRETIGLEGSLPPLDLDLDSSRSFLGFGWSF